MRQQLSEPVSHQVDPHDDRALRAWHDAMYRGQAAGRTEPLITRYPELAAWLRQPDERYEYVLIGLSVEDEVVGTLLLMLPLIANTHLTELDIAVPPEHRNRGYGGTLLARAEEIARARGRQTVFAEAVTTDGAESAGTRFATRHGYTSALHEDRYLLGLPVAEELLAEIEADSEPYQRDYRFASWLGACPPEYLEVFAALHTAMESDVPLGELDYEPEVWDVARVRDADDRMLRQGKHAITTMALAGDGDAVAYSALLVLEHNPGQVSQEDTLVLRAHRGHRLGNALKVRNLRLLAEHFPGQRYVHTWMAASNGPMRRINRALGFVAVEESHEYQRTLA